MYKVRQLKSQNTTKQ